MKTEFSVPIEGSVALKNGDSMVVQMTSVDGVLTRAHVVRVDRKDDVEFKTVAWAYRLFLAAILAVFLALATLTLWVERVL